MKPAEAGGQPLLDLVRRQVELGPRFPGSEAHRCLSRELAGCLEEHGAEAHRQRFTVRLPSGPAECGNLTGIFRPAEAGRRPVLPPLLLGTHFDTRLTADREPEPASRARPIPGANDGGSGTAILLSLLPELSRLAAAGELRREVRVVFFDAEDVGGIGGLPFSLGAALYAAEPPFAPPGEVLVLDMVGGRGLELDLDGHALDHAPSLELTRRVFACGSQVDPAVFRAAKLKHVICDHYPFLRRGIASCLLIDLDYPEWHTHADLPEAMSERSLATIAAAVLRFLPEPRR